MPINRRDERPEHQASRRAAGEEMGPDAPPSERRPQPDAASGSRSTATRVAVIALTVLAFLAVMYTLHHAQSLIVPIVMALLLNLLLSPLVDRISRALHVPHAVAALGMLVLVVGIVVGIAIPLSGPAVAWVDDAPRLFEQAEQKLRNLAKPLERLEEVSKKVDEIAKKAEGDDAISVSIKETSFSRLMLNTTGGFLSSCLVTVALLYFLLAGGNGFLLAMLSTMRSKRSEQSLRHLAETVQRSISHYLLTITIINGLLGVAIGLGMWPIGMPNPALWGAMGAMLNFIPIIGPGIGILVVSLVGLVSTNAPGLALLAPAIYLACNLVEANLVTPAMVGRSISLSPIMIVLSLAIWTWMWGVVGALLAVPILSVLAIVCEHVDELKRFAPLLTGEPLEDHATAADRPADSAQRRDAGSARPRRERQRQPNMAMSHGTT